MGQPLGVVDDGDVGLLVLEQAVHLAADGPRVGGHALGAEQRTGFGPVGRIADQPGPAAGQQHRVVAGPRQVSGERQRDEVPRVQAGRRGIKPDVKCTGAIQGRAQAIRV